MSVETSKPRGISAAFTRRIVSQGALLFSGFAAAQICSFLRNAILAHTLAKGDFGVAATLTMVLTLIESLTDIGADRLIVQSPDGAAPRFVATSHAVLIARGALTSLLLFISAVPFCQFLGIEHAYRAFELIALVPVIKGFSHLDTRLAQRTLNNRPQMLTEVMPQFYALMLTVPTINYLPGYQAVVGLSLIQAAAAVVTSHAVAKTPYALAVDRDVLRRLLAFGWPIWLSALPLCAVYQGDRLVIGKIYGMEALAGYSVAFMITMVPAIIAAKVGHALMLPLLSSRVGNPSALSHRFASLSHVTALAAALYLVVFGVAGGTVVPMAFGEKYAGLGTLTGWLAVMWTIRMIQVVPGMAVMAHGQTRPFLIAGMIRAGALIPALALALSGARIEWLAAAGAAGELASYAYITWRAGRYAPSMALLGLKANAWLAVVAVSVFEIAYLLPEAAPSDHIAAASVLALIVAAYAVSAQASLRDGIGALLPSQDRAAA